jgi:glycosyltransferase involved in cell wall biosynthesis
MPFLEILTRCYKRPTLLQRNLDSIAAQTCDDFTHTLIIDNVGVGVGGAWAKLRDYAPRLVGDYIWILDDDDECIRPSLVEDLKAIAAQHDPDVIMLKMDHGQWGIKPSHSWKQWPELGDIGCSAYVVKRAIWQHHAPEAWYATRYQSDYDFIKSIFSRPYTICWYDVVASRVQVISQGKPEAVII